MKRIFIIFSFIIMSFALAVIFTYLLNCPSYKVLAQWKQPDSIQYDDRGPYYLKILEGDLGPSNMFLERTYHQSLYIGREVNTSVYGHGLEFGIPAGMIYPIQHYKNYIVKWSPQGVTLTTDQGHVLFIPKKLFIGGR